MVAQRALFLHANDVKPALEWLLERFGALHGGGISSDLSSTLSLGSRATPASGAPEWRAAPKAFEFARDPTTPGSRASLPTPSPSARRCCHVYMPVPVSFALTQAGFALPMPAAAQNISPTACGLVTSTMPKAHPSLSGLICLRSCRLNLPSSPQCSQAERGPVGKGCYPSYTFHLLGSLQTACLACAQRQP